MRGQGQDSTAAIGRCCSACLVNQSDKLCVYSLVLGHRSIALESDSLSALLVDSSELQRWSLLQVSITRLSTLSHLFPSRAIRQPYEGEESGGQPLSSQGEQ